MKQAFGNRGKGSRRHPAALAAAAWLRLLAIVAITAVTGASRLQLAGAQEKPSRNSTMGFEESTVATWKMAGAEVGWMGKDSRYGFLRYDTQPHELTGAIPAFRFAQPQEKLLVGLPDPAVSFGLNFWGTKMADAGLKELSVLKSLTMLDLGGTDVTGTGLKELAGLKSLQTLNLDATKLTHGGLKSLPTSRAWKDSTSTRPR
jgi:hypothetical protein